ncbi:MAG: hypothetical protein E7034_01020 [Akkermansiaceae bacterium]|nr:hypothetical protein [Akkermansiaceae bacterium]
MFKNIIPTLIPLLALSLPADAAPQKASTRDLGYTEYYLKEFEAEVRRAQGSANTMFRNKNEALRRIQALMKAYPEDPAVLALYERARAALMMSKGDYQPISPAMVAYLNNEKQLREQYARLSRDKWQQLLQGRDILPKVFPAVDPLKNTPETSPVDKSIVLTDVKYPDNQFVGGTGEYIVVGKPSTGFYFVNISGREWLGPYEAIKRFRREVDGSLGESLNFTVLGKVSSPVMEIPGNRRMNMAWGWVVEPEALYIDGRIVATFDTADARGGSYVEEDKVADIKESWYTEKDVPQDATPERVMEIFLAAIKEKNYELYRKCINPDRYKTETAESLLRYHWDLHQERLHGEYVHAVFSDTKITVAKGHDDKNDLENFFLDDAQRNQLTNMLGEKVEYATVQSRAFDANGKQVGVKHAHKLIRKGGGRWYVDDYAIRF